MKPQFNEVLATPSVDISDVDPQVLSSIVGYVAQESEADFAAADNNWDAPLVIGKAEAGHVPLTLGAILKAMDHGGFHIRGDAARRFEDLVLDTSGLFPDRFSEMSRPGEYVIYNQWEGIEGRMRSLRRLQEGAARGRRRV